MNRERERYPYVCEDVDVYFNFRDRCISVYVYVNVSVYSFLLLQWRTFFRMYNFSMQVYVFRLISQIKVGEKYFFHFSLGEIVSFLSFFLFSFLFSFFFCRCWGLRRFFSFFLSLSLLFDLFWFLRLLKITEWKILIELKANRNWKGGRERERERARERARERERERERDRCRERQM